MAGERRFERLDQVRAQEHEQYPGLGVSQAAVELEHARAPIGRDHEPGVQEPPIGLAGKFRKKSTAGFGQNRPNAPRFLGTLGLTTYQQNGQPA